MKFENQQEKVGPVEDDQRFCTDFKYLLLLVFLVLASVSFGFHGLISGNTLHITQGYDSDHNLCGYDAQVKLYPYIYFTTPDYRYLYRTVCVSQCPTFNVNGTLPTQLSCVHNSQINSCEAQILPTKMSASVFIYNSTEYDKRVCLPSQTKFYQGVIFAIQLNFLKEFFHDINNALLPLFLSIICAILIGLFLSVILIKLAAIIFWSFILIIIFSMILIGLVSFQMYQNFSKFQKYLNYLIFCSDSGLETSQKSSSPITFLIVAIFCWILALLIIISTILFFQRIKKTIEILQNVGEFVQKNIKILLVPTSFYLVFVGFLFLSFQFSIYLYSLGSAPNKPNQFPFQALEFTGWQYFFGFLFLFQIYWFAAFLLGCSDFVVIGTMCIWYFDQNSDGTLTSLKRLFRFHQGTVAIGSLVISIIAIFRFFLELFYVLNLIFYIYIQRQVERLQKSNFSFLVKCCLCCIWIYEKIFQFLTTTAYVETNLSSNNFLKAAAETQKLTDQKREQFMLINGLGDFFTFFARILITIIVIIIFEAFSNIPILLRGNIIVNKNYPILIALIFGYSVGSAFMGLYGVAIESIIHLYCIEKENSPNGEATHCPQSSKIFLQKNIQ